MNMPLFTVGLGAFLAVMLAVGLTGFLHVRTRDDFLLAGRKPGGLSIGGSLTATILGGSSTLGLAGLGFSRGWTGAWWLLAGVIGLGALIVFLPRVRRHPVYTLPELIGLWYGPTVRRVASILILAAWLGIVGAQISAAGRVLSFFLPGDIVLWTILAGLVFIAYTTAGGQMSVIRTDVLQAVLIAAGITTAAAAGLGAVGGWAALVRRLDPGLLSFPTSPSFSPADLLLLLLVVGSTYLMGPDMVSRVFCSRDTRAARRGVVMAAAGLVPAALLVTLIGLTARALFPEAQAESAFPLMIREVLPAPLALLAILALMSALLSSADTTLLTASAIVSVDLLALPEEGVARLRAVTAIVGAAAMGVGLLTRGIIPSLLLGYTVFSGGLLVPVLAALLGYPPRRPAALACMVIGGLLALTGKLLDTDLLIASAFPACLLVAAADRLFFKSKRNSPRR